MFEPRSTVNSKVTKYHSAHVRCKSNVKSVLWTFPRARKVIPHRRRGIALSLYVGVATRVLLSLSDK